MDLQARHINYRQLRCVVDGNFVRLDDGQKKVINYTSDLEYLRKIIRQGMTLSLVDVHEEENGSLSPRFIIIEPDYLIEISAIARCFTDYGHHPLAHLVNRLSPSANSQAILLGNYAGTLLDDTIHGSKSWKETLRNHFAEEALEYATCPDFRQEEYKKQCQVQAKNIEDIVRELGDADWILEPSFVCPALGLQGRVDLMTRDMHILVEQKSGTNYFIEKHITGPYGVYQKEEHYVQLLLYFAVLHQNFNVPIDALDIRLMYSKYPLPDGLLTVGYYQRLLQESLKVRNRIAASDMYFAREGFTPNWLHVLTPELLNEKKLRSAFYQDRLCPQLQRILEPLHHLSPLEEAYFCRMATFLFREQSVSRVGAQDGITRGIADLWNKSAEEKIQTGDAIYDLTITEATATDVTLQLKADGSMLNFRDGDSAYLYEYDLESGPDVTSSILYKGVIAKLTSTHVTVHLNDPQKSFCSVVNRGGKAYAVEHGSSGSMSSGLRALHMLMAAPQERRDLLLGQRKPEFDTTKVLSRSYHPSYDDVLLRAKQAKDYFLLVGPPGTGKTSLAMKFMVQEHLCSLPTSLPSSRGGRGESGSILLTSYTNRAIDEICEMLTDAGIDYLRIGNTYSCDERFRDHLASKMFAEIGNMQKIRERIAEVPVVVATTSMLMGHQQILDMKKFTLTIVDEASQILEPNIIGLLARLHKFILIGDHKQLPAVVQQTEQDSAVTDPVLLNIGLTNCRNSLFERLITAPQPPQGEHSKNVSFANAYADKTILKDSPCGGWGACGTLHFHGRMHPEVAAWPCKMFYRDEELLPVPLPHQKETMLDYKESSIDDLDDKLRQHRVLFFDVHNDNNETDIQSNLAEAKLCARIVARLYRQLGDRWNPQKSIGIIVPYRNQISLIRQELEKTLPGPHLKGCSISIDTVERYQGSQRDIIIYSFTVSQVSQLDFLTSSTFMCHSPKGDYPVDRKLNVALTRARKQMIMLGNKRLLSTNPLFRDLIQTYSE